MAVAAGIGAAGSIVGGMLGGKGAKKAAKIQLQATRETNALNEKLYNQNTQNISPFMQRGNTAGATLNALLGLGQDTTDWGAFVRANPEAMAAYEAQQRMPAFLGGASAMFGLPTGIGNKGVLGGKTIEQFGQDYYKTNGGDITPYTSTAQDQAEAAFDAFRGGTNYNFRLNEGMDALNTRFAGAGKLQSGPAARAAIEYGQNIASNELGNYINLLANQQGVGLSGANALAGVATNYGNQVAQANQANATTAGNAALAQASMMGQGIAGAANSIGNALGSSYSGDQSRGVWVNPNALPSYGR